MQHGALLCACNRTKPVRRQTPIREWGCIGRRGQRRVENHNNRTKAAEALAIWLRRKQKRDYTLRG
ncbi:WGR domain-containing protein [Microvirga brassicacearum]|uniref:WGR domain-containing protein n=1 Tax=Microvirga brassicacearum TaxID=2580413 RepID=UPI001FCE6030|nr:WGR domain-containing protein [Microvirga brassicacearum]